MARRTRRGGPDLLEQLHTGSLAERADRAARAESSLLPTSERLRSGAMWLILLLSLVVFAVVIGEQGKQPYPELTPSCTAAAVALNPTSAKPLEQIRYTAVGPDGDVLIALNSIAVDRDGIATPTRTDAVTQVFDEQLQTGCRTQGSFPAQVPVGEHTVTVFRLVGGTWTAVASTALTVR